MPSLANSSSECGKMTPEAERFNGWAAMIGIVAAIGTYAVTGQIIPGIW
jgi:hypothetical protein